MKKRQKYLEQHEFKIWKGNDDKYRTYLPDEKKGRRLLKRSNKSDIEDEIINYYKLLEEKSQITFQKMYWKWRKVQDELVCENTTCKYDTDYIRFFKDTDFEKTVMEKLNEEDIKVFLCSTIKRKTLNKKAAKTLFGYINNVVKSARVNKIIVDNPMEFLEAKQFYKYCTEVKKPIEKKIVSDKEMHLLYEQFNRDYQEQPEYIPTYAVEFATLTGFRVAEISALKWDSITDEYIIVDKSEKYNRKTKEYYIDKTKNQKERIFPLTTEIKDLLNRVKKAEMKSGYICEWVFANENGRIHAPIISSCTKNKCRQVGITEKGIHAYRKTVNSKMRCNGVSSVVAASLLGHSQEVNEEYYTFDVASLEDKIKVVSTMNKQMLG
ncbi:tyrosine-type recombinase/integrase [Bariatricus sp. HCP28S3_A7]|uniref:tyrosine-type recombinase/integrase n=1 Tax=Bariatricus sp. HCP28S3_A7 TaxID=3438894 RepID=UPI003F8CD375